MDIGFKLLILFGIYFMLNETSSFIMDINRHKNSIRKCSKCPPGWGVVKKCTKYTDTVCKKCEFGESYSSHYSLTSPCWSCSRCGVGLYEARRCTVVRDTICDECISIIDHKNFTKKNDFVKKCSYLFLKNHKNFHGRVLDAVSQKT